MAGQIVKKYIANVRKMLEVETPAGEAAQAPAAATTVNAAAASSAAQAAPAATPPQEDAINMGAIVFKALWMNIIGFFSKLLGGKKTGGQASCSK